MNKRASILQKVIVALCLVWMTSSLGLAQESIDPGLPVGTKAPAFELSDQNGKKRSLDSLLQKEYLALLFYRSADW